MSDQMMMPEEEKNRHIKKEWEILLDNQEEDLESLQNNMQQQMMQQQMQQIDQQAVAAYEQEEQEKEQQKKDRMAILRDIVDNDAVIKIPKKTKLVGEFKNSFRSKVSDTARAKKQMNKRSRLFQKAKNADALKDMEDKVMDDNIKYMSSMIGNSQEICGIDELSDLAAFVSKDNVLSKQILKDYLGEGDDQKGMDRQKAMDRMLAVLTNFKLENLDLSNDKVLADHAKELEELTWRVSAFESLATKNGYFDGLDLDTEKTVNKKLDMLKSVATYYNLRKEVINDPMYKSHYNEELSMDVTAAETPEQKVLAEKLLKAHLAGVEMMKQNGTDSKTIASQMTPMYKKYQEGRAAEEKIEWNISHGMESLEMANKYKQSGRPIAKMSYAMRNNIHHAEAYKEEFRQKAISNYENIEGNIECQDGYKQELYDPAKVMGYVNELKSYKVTDIRFSSYRDLIEHYSDNYRICDRVHYLHFQITKAILNGYTDPALKDSEIMELRARSMCFNSIKNTLIAVNGLLVENKDSAGYTDDQWEEKIKYCVKSQKNPAYPAMKTFLSNINEILGECRTVVAQEEAEKEQSIRTTYKYLLSPNGTDNIPAEELKRRKKDYQRNALVHDYTSQNTYNTLDVVVDSSSQYLNYLSEKYGKNYPVSRIISAMSIGKPAKEVERLYKLSTGNTKERMQFYMEVVNRLGNFDIELFDTRDMGKFFENWTLLNELSAGSDGQMNDVFRAIEGLMKNDPTLTLPEEFKTLDDLKAKIDLIYDVGQVLATRSMGVSQFLTNKWVNALSLEELGSFDAKKMEVVDNNMALNEDEMELGSMEDRAFTKIQGSLKFVNLEDRDNPENRITFSTDIKALYEARKKLHFKS